MPNNRIARGERNKCKSTQRMTCGAEVHAPRRCTCEQRMIVERAKGRNAAAHFYNATAVRQKTAREAAKRSQKRSCGEQRAKDKETTTSPCDVETPRRKAAREAAKRSKKVAVGCSGNWQLRPPERPLVASFNTRKVHNTSGNG